MPKIYQNDLSVSGPENLAWAKKWLIPDIIIHLKKKVQVDKLKEAVRGALELHPWYQTMMTVNERHEPIRIPNTKPVIVPKFKRNEHILYGTAKYNHYSWLIRYTNKKIVVSISHMLSDGTGALNFIKSVLQYYFEKTGDLPTSISKKDISLAYKTTENSYLKYSKGKQKKLENEETPSQPSKITSQLLLKDKENLQTYKFVMSKKKIKELSIEFNVRPVTITSALFAKALATTLKLSKGTIDLPVPVNCRNYFSSNTDRNFIYASLLKYDIEKMKKANLKFVAQDLNRQFQELATKENMQDFFREVSTLTSVFKQSVKGAYNIRKNANKNNNDRTATICYSHITRTNMPEEFSNLIENIEVSALPPRDGSVVYIFGVNFEDKITFSIKHIFKGNAFTKNLMDILKHEKIDYTLSKPRHKCLAKFFTVK